MPSTWLTECRDAAGAVGVAGDLQVDVAERLQPGAEPRGRAADAPGDRAQPAVPAGQQRDDPVGLAQFLHAQHHRVVAVELAAVSGHPPILPDAGPSCRSQPLGRSRRSQPLGTPEIHQGHLLGGASVRDPDARPDSPGP